MTDTELVGAIDAGIRELGQSAPDDCAEKLATLAGELARWNRRMNLTAVREPRDMVALHLLDSLSVRAALEGDSVIDIGTGAGFPGLPLALTEPGRRFTLLDGNARKIGFVRHMLMQLELGNAEAVQGRAECYVPERRFATVVARAVTSLAGLIKVGDALMDDNGVLLAMKGKRPDEELDEVPDDWTTTVTELEVPGLPPRSRHLVAVRRVTV